MPQPNAKRSSLGPIAIAAVLLALFSLSLGALAQSDDKAAKPPAAEGEGPMDNARLGDLLSTSFPDRKIEGREGAWRIDLTEIEEGKPDEPADDAGDDGANEEGDGKDEEPAPDPGEGEGDFEEDGLEEEELGPGAGNRLPATLIVLTDERANRMRLMMPIRPFDPDNLEDLQLALIALHANYDRALDARYAVQEGALWSVFIHPLNSLTPDDLANAIFQVQELRKNTGTTYSSSGLLFGGGRRGRGGEPPLTPDNPNDDVI